jgi:hypothetical protein
MAANNINPIFTGIPDIQWGTLITTANTAKDGTGTVVTCFTADAINGGFVSKIRFRAAGTNVATVCRIFINNGSTNTTAANNSLYDEITLSATTLSEVAAVQLYELALNIALPAGYKINITIGTTVAAGYYPTVIGGKYTQSA